MKLALTLALRRKPLTTSLIGDRGEYRSKAVVQAMNFARAFGSAQLLASMWNFEELKEMVARAKREIELMSMVAGEFEFITVDGPLSDSTSTIMAVRIDLKLATEPSVRAG